MYIIVSYFCFGVNLLNLVTFCWYWYLINLTVILWSILCSSQGSVPVPRQTIEMKCTWAACPALSEGWSQGSRWGTKQRDGVVQDVVRVYQKRFDWQDGVRGISAGDKPCLQSPPPFSIHQAHVSSLPLRQTLTRQWYNETKVSSVFVLIGTRQFSPDIRAHTHSTGS